MSDEKTQEQILQESELRAIEIISKTREAMKIANDMQIDRARLIIDALQCYEVETTEAGTQKLNSPFTQKGKDKLVKKLFEIVDKF